MSVQSYFLHRLSHVLVSSFAVVDFFKWGRMHFILAHTNLIHSFLKIDSNKFYFFLGVLYSASGSYESSFFTIGAVMAVSCCLMFLIPFSLPNHPEVSIVIDDEMSDSSAKLSDKKDSWVAYDSGIDLTIKDTSSFECTIDDDRELTKSKSSSLEVINERRFFNFLDRYIRTRRRTLVPGNLVNTYAVSSLELNTEQLYVVDRVTIV